MSQIITAVYENGVLRPLQPLSLQENQTVQLEVLTEVEPANAAIQSLVAQGLITPPPKKGKVEPVSEHARRELAQRLGQYQGKPLSEIIIEERGSI